MDASLYPGIKEKQAWSDYILEKHDLEKLKLGKVLATVCLILQRRTVLPTDFYDQAKLTFGKKERLCLSEMWLFFKTMHGHTQLIWPKKNWKISIGQQTNNSPIIQIYHMFGLLKEVLEGRRFDNYQGVEAFMHTTHIILR